MMLAFTEGFITLRIPDNFEGVLYHRYSGRFTYDTDKWCWENLRQQPSLEISGDRVYVIFWNDVDSIVFKMRWF